MRSIEVCRIIAAEAIANCAKKDDKYTKKFPDEMHGDSAWDEADMFTLGSALEECDRTGKLKENPFEKMGSLCLIGFDCGDIDGFFTTDKIGKRKLINKFESCIK